MWSHHSEIWRKETRPYKLYSNFRRAEEKWLSHRRFPWMQGLHLHRVWSAEDRQQPPLWSGLWNVPDGERERSHPRVLGGCPGSVPAEWAGQTWEHSGELPHQVFRNHKENASSSEDKTVRHPNQAKKNASPWCSIGGSFSKFWSSGFRSEYVSKSVFPNPVLLISDLKAL